MSPEDYARQDAARYKALPKAERKKLARKGWVNWYINRGRLPLNPTKKELRAVSWRRVK